MYRSARRTPSATASTGFRSSSAHRPPPSCSTRGTCTRKFRSPPETMSSRRWAWTGADAPTAGRCKRDHAWPGCLSCRKAFSGQPHGRSRKNQRQRGGALPGGDGVRVRACKGPRRRTSVRCLLQGLWRLEGGPWRRGAGGRRRGRAAVGLAPAAASGRRGASPPPSRMRFNKSGPAAARALKAPGARGRSGLQAAAPRQTCAQS